MVAGPRAKFSSVGRAAVVSDLTPERRWRIVLARDRRYDGAFVYAVHSTGIYCRPSCPSRRPRRAQVAFFPVPGAAELAGFRPCRRCRPGEAAAAVPGVPLVRAVCRLIDAHPDRPASLAALSAQAGVTSHRLLRTFRRVLGISPRQYRDARRLDRFKTELRARGRVSPALYEAGYGSTSRVYERAHAQLGMTPATYSRGAPGTRIAFAIVPCAFGRLLVATTARGICRISLGSGAKALAAGLRAEFPAAELRRDRSALAASVGALLRYLDGRPEPLDLPLDVRAIGAPSATRAVARACATNPVALVIPCHRVVRADGGLGGYRWGVARKRSLLEQERVGT